MENLPAKRDPMAIDFESAEMLATLKATVAVGTTDAEFKMFIGFCKGTGLNPFKKEIWCIKTPGKKYKDQQGNWKQGDDKIQIMTGINGFFSIANSNGGFDGHESGLIDPNGEFVKGSYPKEDYIGAWCKVYRKDRRIPTEAIAMLKEYDKSIDSSYSQYGIWNKMRRVMIVKCAESIGLRKTFPQELNGMYTAEEMPPEYAVDVTTQKPNPYNTEVKPRIECSIKTEDAKMTKKQKLTMEAIEAKKSFQYDLHGVGNSIPDEKEKEATWKCAVRDFGAVRVGLVCHCYQAIPEFYNFWINEQELFKGEENNSHDDLPDSFNEKEAQPG